MVHHGSREVDVAALQRDLDVERLLTPAEVAELFKVNPLTVTPVGGTGAGSGLFAPSAQAHATRRRKCCAYCAREPARQIRRPEGLGAALSIAPQSRTSFAGRSDDSTRKRQRPRCTVSNTASASGQSRPTEVPSPADGAVFR